MASALICVGSPLQAICMVEAISEYSIDTYRLLVIDDGTRLGQIEYFLNKERLVFTVIPYHVSSWKNIIRLIGLFNPFKGKYDYLIMGDYRLTGNKIEYIPFIKNHGQIIYLDDGSYIISLSKGLMKETAVTKVRNRLIGLVCKHRGIINNNLFTIFSKDLCFKGFSVKENCLRHFQKRSISLGNDIYFVGTNPVGYCTFLGIDYYHYLDVLRSILLEILQNNPEVHIVYVPHGRDVSNETIDICKQLNIEYKRLSICIELFMLSLDRCPKEIWGVGSSALYTLRRLFNDTIIKNVTIQGTNCNSLREYKEIADVYEKNDIENVWID